MEPLQHDPRTKQQIKDTLYELLYLPIQKRFQDMLNQIIVKNVVAGKYTHRSFIYRNELYNIDTQPLPRKMNRLLPQFQPEMDSYLREIKQLNEAELPYVLGFINQVLNSSNELHDYLRLLPESVHQPIEHLINTCPCRNKKLSDEGVQALLEKNHDAIGLMRKRMVINLVI